MQPVMPNVFSLKKNLVKNQWKHTDKKHILAASVTHLYGIKNGKTPKHTDKGRSHIYAVM